MLFYVQIGRTHQLVESKLKPIDSVTLSLYPQFELYRNMSAEKYELVVYFSMKNDSDSYRLYDSSSSFLVIHDGINHEPIFSEGARTLTSQETKLIEIPGRTTKTYSMQFFIPMEFSMLNDHVTPTWYGDDNLELDLSAHLELTPFGRPDIVKSKNLEGFSVRLINTN